MQLLHLFLRYAIISLIMKNIIQFYINKGEKYYVAQGIDLPVVTQGKTLDELMKNIKEAVELHLEGEKPENLGLSPHPSVLVNMEIQTKAYA